MIYFIADTHFGHKKILKLCNRPFQSVKEMDQTLISNWNSRVKGNDTVYILGDMFFDRTDSFHVKHVLSALKGKKHLIVGNHDGSWLNDTEIVASFDIIKPYSEISVSNHGVVLCHYPLVSYKHDTKKYMIHGHIHSDTSLDYWSVLCVRDRILNAGVDINRYMPVTFDELLENNRQFKALNYPSV